MNIESDIFKRSVVDFEKLEKYGFIKMNNTYYFEKTFLDNQFKTIITVNNDGSVNGRVIDLEFNEEYKNIRINMSGEFVGKVREEYKSILFDIKDNCFENRYFLSNQSNRIADYIKIKYGNSPEFLWDKLPGCGVFRCKSSNKWYGIIMNIDFSKIDNCSGEIEVLNVKLDQDEILELLKRKGFYKAYHMSKKDWISIVLNDTLNDDEILSLIDKSYNLVK